MNHVFLEGRIGKDPVLRKTQSGKSVTSISLALSNGKDQDGKERPSTWVNCQAWDGRAEAIAQYFKSGDQIIIGGRLNTRPKDGADGKTTYITEVVIDEFSFGAKSKANAEKSEPKQEAKPTPNKGGAQPQYIDDEPILDISSDDLPF